MDSEKNPPEVETAYRAAHDHALHVRHAPPALLRLAGRDRLDLLQRMSTNDVSGLTPGEIRTSVLTNPIGRIIDVLDILTLEDELLLLIESGHPAKVRSWLQSHIFFQDEVQIEPWPEGWSLWGIYGPQAEAEVRRLAPLDPAPPLGRFFAWEHGYAWPVAMPGAGGIRLLLDPAASEAADRAWESGPAEADAFETLRIEAGLPRSGREISEDSIPLEVGLWDAVSFQKGCYIGQEIIARMESRRQLAKKLMRVHLAGPGQAPAEMRQEGRRIGSLTSVAYSPSLGWIGLAIVRPDAVRHAGGLALAGDEGTEARLEDLPPLLG